MIAEFEEENAASFDLITLGRNLNNSFNKLFTKHNIDSRNLKYVIIENQIKVIAVCLKVFGSYWKCRSGG